MGHSTPLSCRREAEQDGVNERRELIPPRRTELPLWGQTEIWGRRGWNGPRGQRGTAAGTLSSDGGTRMPQGKLGGIFFGGYFSSMAPDPKKGLALHISLLLSFYVPTYKDNEDDVQQ